MRVPQVSKGHYNAEACDWWRRPTGLLARVVRLSYSYSISPTSRLTDDDGPQQYPRRGSHMPRTSAALCRHHSSHC